MIKVYHTPDGTVEKTLSKEETGDLAEKGDTKARIEVLNAKWALTVDKLELLKRFNSGEDMKDVL